MLTQSQRDQLKWLQEECAVQYAMARAYAFAAHLVNEAGGLALGKQRYAAEIHRTIAEWRGRL